MSKWIDTDEFEKDICDSIDQMTSIGIAVDGEWLWGKLLDALENAPSIDIVQCKECKHWLGESEIYEDKEYKRCYSFGGSYTAPDDFCSYGERTE